MKFKKGQRVKINHEVLKSKFDQLSPGMMEYVDKVDKSELVYCRRIGWLHRKVLILNKTMNTKYHLSISAIATDKDYIEPLPPGTRIRLNKFGKHFAQKNKVPSAIIEQLESGLCDVLDTDVERATVRIHKFFGSIVLPELWVTACD